MRKGILIALIFFSCLLCPGVTYAAEYTFQVDMGSFDIWKNSAGDWIPSEPPRYMEASKPGDTVQILPYQIPGPENATGVKSVRQANDIEAWELGGRTGEYAEYDAFFAKALQNIEYSYIPETHSIQVQYSCTLETAPRGIEKTTLGDSITKEWQAETVEGYRYYMPLLVEWETSGLDIGVELSPRQPYWQIPSDLGYVHPAIDINFSANIDNHQLPIFADGYKEAVGIKSEDFEMIKHGGEPPMRESFSFKVTQPGKYIIRAGIPTEDENGNPILFKVDEELQPDINPANNHAEIVIEVGIGPPSQIKTEPDIDTGYDGGDHIRGDITG